LTLAVFEIFKFFQYKTPAIARAATSTPSVLRGWSIPLHAGVCCYSFEYIKILTDDSELMKRT
ncbi:hypothetical protein C0J52_17919, partial [Blattella germanica]